MSEHEPIGMAKDGISLVVEVLKAAGDSPQVKEAAGNLGQTAVTLTRTINNILVPLAAINFAFEKARTYFSGRFQEEIALRAEAIPPEYLIEPKASIAGPTLQGLAFTHEEPNLKDMYLNLLATCMDRRAASLAHPAFVEIIKQLDSEDARLIREVLQTQSAIPIVQVHRTLKDGGYNVLLQHLLDTKSEAGQIVEDTQMPAMIDNWVRLGLVEVSYERHLSDVARYEWVEHRPEFLKLVKSLELDRATIQFEKGVMVRTALGCRFGNAIGL